MKKTLLTFIMVVAAFCAANAQVYLGGSIGFSTSSIDLDDTNGGSSSDLSLESTSFRFIPELGYTLNSKWDVGIQFQMEYAETPLESYNGEYESTSWAVGPYFRYNIIRFKKFSVLAKGQLSFGGGTDKIKYYNSKTEIKATAWGFNAKPMLKFDLNKHFSLLADLNFFSLGINQIDYKDNSTVTSFGLLFDSSDVLSIGGDSAVTIGFAYTF